MSKRSKWIIGITIGLLILLVLRVMNNLEKAFLVRQPDVYLTEQRTMELAGFAEKLFREVDANDFLVISHRRWLPTRVSASGALSGEQIRSIKRMLRANNLHLISVDGQQGVVTYGHFSLRTWCCYIYAPGHDKPPHEPMCPTVRSIKSDWYFGIN